MSKPLISIVIATWNSDAYLPRCLNSLSLQTFQDFEIIIVDNGSDDDCIRNVKDKWPALSIRVERLDRNYGFAKANNLGARLAAGEWLALLNTDAFPEPDWLLAFTRAVKHYPDYQVFGSRILQDHDPELLDGTGDIYHVSGLAWKRHAAYPIELAPAEPTEIFSACAAAAFYAKDAFLESSGFDEDFFSYFEDVDLGFRLRLNGCRALFLPDAVVRHIGSASTLKDSNFGLYHYQRNYIWSFIQNMPETLFWKYFLLHILVNLVFLVYYIRHGKGKIVLKAKLDAIAGLPRALRKRSVIQKNSKVDPLVLLQNMDHNLLSPFQLSRERKNAIQK